MKRRLTPFLWMLLAACHRHGDAPYAHAGASIGGSDAGKAAQLDAGRRIYNLRCYFCHGYSGDAHTLAATYLDPPPRDFTRARIEELPLTVIEQAVRDGRPGTAMKSFRAILGEEEQKAVAAFVADEFVVNKAPNTAYHTPENGWAGHERFRAAYPFATGAVPLDTDPATLTAEQAEGRQLFISSCVSCHDRARVVDAGPAWSARPLSYPRFDFVPGGAPVRQVDAVTGASPYAKHDVAPKIADLSATERHGEKLYQENCAFCHAADGTGANWIGRFMEPPARDLTQFTPQSMPAPRLVETIRNGLQGTSMPAWRHVLKGSEIEAIAAYVRRVFMRKTIEQPVPRDDTGAAKPAASPRITTPRGTAPA
jgi:cytochrome c oxidase cbb3-type subunit 3